MSGAAEDAELATNIAVPEERTNTGRADYKTDIARLAEENARRDARLIVVIVGLLVAGITIVGFVGRT